MTTYGLLAGGSENFEECDPTEKYISIIDTKQSTLMTHENRLDMGGAKLTPAAILIALDILSQHRSVRIENVEGRADKVYHDWKELLHADFE